MEAVQWVLNNKENIAEAVIAILAVGAVIVRLTPTKSDDGIFKKVDDIVNKVLDWVKVVPNNRRK